jgi:hypothetical protein
MSRGRDTQLWNVVPAVRVMVRSCGRSTERNTQNDTAKDKPVFRMLHSMTTARRPTESYDLQFTETTRQSTMSVAQSTRRTADMFEPRPKMIDDGIII